MKSKAAVRRIVEELKALYPDARCSLNYQKDYELLFAVLRPMPGRAVSSSIVPGTLPPYFSSRIFAHSTRSFDFVL